MKVVNVLDMIEFNSEKMKKVSNTAKNASLQQNYHRAKPRATAQ